MFSMDVVALDSRLSPYKKVDLCGDWRLLAVLSLFTQKSLIDLEALTVNYR
jgi:hypothetical protein